MKDEKSGKQAVSPEAKAMGERIRLARKAKGLTMEKLAEAADTSPQFLSKVEKGEQSMTMGKLAALARALGVSSDYILFGYRGLEGLAEIAVDYMLRMNPIERDILARFVCNMMGFLDALGLEEG